MYQVSEPYLVLLVIDATIGQQAYDQAKAFHKAAPVGGIVISKLTVPQRTEASLLRVLCIVISKLDGTAKDGGVIAA